MRIKVRMGTLRKAFVAPVAETPAHADFLTVEHFGKLVKADSFGLYKEGESVAVLLATPDSVRVVHAVVYGSTYNAHTGIRYKVIMRDGTRYENLSNGLLAHI